MNYSPSKNGFFPPNLEQAYRDAGSWPNDLVEITPEQHATLLQGQSEGKIIAADENGYPVLQDPPPAPPYVPQQVTRAQGKAALIQAGLWDAVESYVDGITDPTEKALALVALNDTTHWQRTSPFLNEAAAALGLTQEQMDSLFKQASEIEL